MKDKAKIKPRIVIVGLGPADERFFTAEAEKALRRKDPILLRTARHPACKVLLDKGATSLDHCYEQASDMEAAYLSIVEEVVTKAKRHGRVVYAVPGSPYVLEATVSALLADERVRCEIVVGMSFLELCWARLSIDPIKAGVQLVDGERFATDAADATGAVLITQVWSQDLLSSVKLAVEDAPKNAVILHHLGLKDELVLEVAFEDLDRSLKADHLTSVFLPARVSLGASLVELVDVVRELRVRCPWDAAQTHISLIRHFVEETYEAIEAIENLGEPISLEASAHLEEELGDVLCQVLFHSAIAAEEGLFSFGDVARTLRDKLVLRHPHVFVAGEQSASAEDVLSNWERAKQEEKGRSSVLEGIPAGLPALSYAEKVLRRSRPVLGDGERTELETAIDALVSSGEAGLGDVLLAVAHLSVRAGVDAEEALRTALRRTIGVVRRAEELASVDGVDLADLDESVKASYVAQAKKEQQSL